MGMTRFTGGSSLSSQSRWPSHRRLRRFLDFAQSSPRWSLRDLHGVAVIALRAMRDVPTYCQVRLIHSFCENVEYHHVFRASQRKPVRTSGSPLCPPGSTSAPHPTIEGHGGFGGPGFGRWCGPRRPRAEKSRPAPSVPFGRPPDATVLFVFGLSWLDSVMNCPNREPAGEYQL